MSATTFLDGRVTLHCGDCLDVLATMPSESVDCIVTSPPYYGLRDYGHAGQIGLEDTPSAFVAALVAVFREVRRVLRRDGTCWLNIGDSYAGSWGAQGHRINDSDDPSWHGSQIRNHPKRARQTGSIREAGLKQKDLMGIPWRLAFALRDDGWFLRQDIIWHKPNPMPESVRDRCTKAHEYVFLLSKSERYHYDTDAIAERQVSDRLAGNTSHKAAEAFAAGDERHRTKAGLVAFAQRGRSQTRRAVEFAAAHGLTDEHIAAIRAVGITDAGKAQKRNRRSVWSIAVQPFTGAHFAIMAPELAQTCILAGCPRGGTVLDPFGGAGTTALVALRHGRRAVLIEINPDYAVMARRRIEREWRVRHRTPRADDGPLFATELAVDGDVIGEASE